jgi:hypothetical protein
MSLFSATNWRHGATFVTWFDVLADCVFVAVGTALLCVLLIELAGAISSIRVFFFGSRRASK